MLIKRLLLIRFATALSAEDRALADLSPAERQTLLEGIEEERTELGATLEKQFGVPMSGEETLIGNAGRMQTRLADIEKAARAVQDIETAEAEAISAAAKITIWTKVSPQCDKPTLQAKYAQGLHCRERCCYHCERHPSLVRARLTLLLGSRRVRQSQGAPNCR